VTHGDSGPFTPVLASGAAGVALSFADVRFDRPGDRELTASMWIAHSHDAGRTWSESRLGAPFDLRRGPRTGGKNLFLGDYAGLVPLPDGFGASVVQAPPAATKGRSDVFFTRATLGRRPKPLRIAVTLHPQRIRAGHRSRVTFVVRGLVDGRRRPLADARVRVGQAHAQTSGRGRVSGFFKLAAGRHRVVATKPGFRRGTATLRVSRR
jgi:hypothetical protein